MFSRMPGLTRGRTCIRRRRTADLRQARLVGRAQAPRTGPLGQSWVRQPTRRRVACPPKPQPSRSCVPAQPRSRMPTGRSHSPPARRSDPPSSRSRTRPTTRQPERLCRGRFCSPQRQVRCPPEVRRQTVARQPAQASRVRPMCLRLVRCLLVVHRQTLPRQPAQASPGRATCLCLSPAQRRSLSPRRSRLVQTLARPPLRGSRVRATCLRPSPARHRSLSPRRSRLVPTLARRPLVSGLQRRLLADRLRLPLAARPDSPPR